MEKEKEKKEFNIILRLNETSKVLTVPINVKFPLFCSLIAKKYNLKSNWKDEYQMMYRHKDSLYPINKDTDLQQLITLKIQLITFFLKEQKKNQEIAPKRIDWIKPSVLSTQPKKIKKHNIACNNCNITPIVGYRFMCSLCTTINYNLCEICFSKRLKEKFHEHYAFIIIEDSGKYNDEAGERFKAKAELDNEIARERIRNYCATLEPVSAISVYKNPGEKEQLFVEQKVHDPIEEQEEFIEDEGEKYESEIIRSMYDNHQDNPNFDKNLQLNNRHLIGNDQGGNKRDNNDDKMLINDEEAYETITEQYCDLFTDESTNDDIGNQYFEDDQNQDYKIIVNNNQTKVQDYFLSKNWICIEMPFDSNLKELVCITLSTSKIEPNIKYINYEEKKLTFMFKELTEKTLNETYEYHFQLCSINTEVIHRSPVCKIMLIINN